ncbi:hypothetical protein [Corynebacterium sp. MC3]|uniref:hypothetical protein n=1 Tax=Corynebacterium sp. MC3 TaxID=1720193 RepID=UPI00115FE5B9|nr:hypothetical protein [Corynebacterium sp. MC3]
MAISMPQDFEHALTSMLNGESVVIDGAPGTGKSTLLRTFMEANDALPENLRKRVLPVALLGGRCGRYQRVDDRLCIQLRSLHDARRRPAWRFLEHQQCKAAAQLG